MFIATAAAFIIRLFYIQVVDKTYKLSAENNTLRHITQYPSRGLIFDRNGKIIVSNTVYYDLKAVVRSIKNPDTAKLAAIIGMPKDELAAKINNAKNTFRPIEIKSQIPAQRWAYIQEKVYQYPGFYAEKRTLRSYPEHTASHLLGYINEVDDQEIEQDQYYRPGDYIGKTGIEKMYEKYLRGKKGVKIFNVDVLGKVQGQYQDGRYDSTALAGRNLTATIDAELQAYGEKLMRNKIGGVVAIEPQTGEILAVISSPGYDPALFVGEDIRQNYSEVKKRKAKPLFNRALNSMQPPGSTFKLLNALVGLQKGVITPLTTITANGYYAGSHYVGDHVSGSISFQRSIQMSSNAYYCHVFKRILSNPDFPDYASAYADWKKSIQSFGTGIRLETDLDPSARGIIYDSDYFDRYYGKNKWSYNTIISLSIGQGELGFTPLQTANAVATIANRGYYYLPHAVKKIEGGEIDKRFKKKIKCAVKAEHFPPVIEAMEKVVSAGTARSIFNPNIAICGKTGTAQNPHGKDHSIFVAFAPKDNPKIAISVLVENAGYGSTWAAPVAGLMIEKYLTDSITKPHLEKRLLEADFIHTQKKKNAGQKTQH